ncbi:MAG: hypothetical protein ABT03_04530 [Comamonas sp. SCN 67-35]|uniref:hypothetical protein n=1 Tax=unclassified Comamonas TaxID=2638500 RepID=UPI00086B1633|nr:MULTISPECIES: hypothetical protein [unclassified Comamonas]ODU39402.1 MAG: hypothetical protein ABT03_04530 [Comamonas sp. SCN 67-35]OJW96673.1 MAG: hypothetical protein BGO73_05220 [Burkholderiales bacterium 66-26]
MTALLRLTLATLALLLAGCGNAPPVPDWQMNAHDAAGRAVQAWLSGDDKVAQSEWQRAFDQAARTGRPEVVARLALLQCAAEVASLRWQECTRFEALRVDADARDRAYADYLAGGRMDGAQAALLPEAQRAAARDVGAIAAIEDPLSRLVAAGAALRAGRADARMPVIATDTASGQGWRRPLLAWLLLRRHQAQAAGDETQAQALQRRIDIVQGER